MDPLIEEALKIMSANEKARFDNAAKQRRESIAIAAMEGMYANPFFDSFTCEKIALLAYTQADAMIAEGDKYE